MLFKNTIRKIKKSFGRYLSLFLITFLGVGFYAGIIVSVPDIQSIQSDYYDETSLMDLKIQSSIGLTNDDISAINELSEVDIAIGSYSLEVLEEDNVIAVHSISDEVSQFKLISGVMPEEVDECLADDNYYRVGDVIEITETNDEMLITHKYKVVGTITSPLYTSTDYGNASIGNGKLYSFIFVLPGNFDIDYYTESYVLINKDSDDTPYSDTYKKKIENVTEILENLGEKRCEDYLEELTAFYSQNTFFDISGVDATWYVQNRNDVINSYQILESQYEQVTTIANVIPIFFIAIVALMTSNTMTRMITEERSEIGTFVSLGVTNKRIIFNYLFYVLSSTVLGGIVGYFLGTIILPKLVYNCFPVNFPEMTYQFRPKSFCLILTVSCLLMIIVTTFSCLMELKNKPASLLRPKAPKCGKKILLERVSFLWKHLSFSSKVTFRNISRYKKRVIMTIIGAGGSTLLIMIGFAIRDSINTIGDMQYSELFTYDNLIILSENVADLNELDDDIDNYVSNPYLLNQSSYKVVDDNTNLDAYLVIASDNDKLTTYFNLRDVSDGTGLSLDDDGVIITPKISERFNVKVGDFITIKDADNNEYQIKISGITENYVSNYIYISKNLAEEIFGEKVTYNAIVSLNKLSNNEVASNILKIDEVLSISFSDDLLKTANESVSGLNNIVVLLVVISSALAFTILYNLTSINISERIREIATLKVLGFKDGETNEYIYRETFITVIVGIIIGLFVTTFVHSLIMDLLETDNAIFLRKIEVSSYVYSGMLTFSFAVIMQLITYFKLKKVDMIESLKSVE